MGELAVVSALVATLVPTGLLMWWVGRAGARRRIDWNWGGHTADATPAGRWDSAHRVAGPTMERAGLVMAAAGVVGGALVVVSEPIGVGAVVLLVVVSLVLTIRSIGSGLRVLEVQPGTGTDPSDDPGP